MIVQQNSLYLYPQVTKLSYHILFKKDHSWLLDLKLQAKSLQGILLFFLKDRDDFDNKVETFYNPTIKKVNVTICKPHRLFKGGILSCNMFLEICKKFYQENSNVTFSEYLTTKYGLWVDTRLSRGSRLHNTERLVNSGIKLQIDKVAEASDYLICYVFAVQDAYAHLCEGKLEAIDM